MTVTIPADHYVHKPQTILTTPCGAHLVLVRALSPPTRSPPVPTYLLEPVVALKVITQCSVSTLLLLIKPLLY